MNNLILVRHGPTVSNDTGAIVGITDININNEGIQIAHLLGRALSSDIDIIVTSPQIRAIHTGNIIGKYNSGIPIITHPMLHPQNFGVLEGKTLDEVRSSGLAQFIHTQSTNRYTHKVDGGETIEEMDHRIMPEVESILKYANSQSKRILLVTHNSVQRIVWGNKSKNLSSDIWTKKNFSQQSYLSIGSEHEQIESHDIFDGHEDKMAPIVKFLLNIDFQRSDFNMGNFLSQFAKLVEGDELYLKGSFYSIFPHIPSHIIRQLDAILGGTISIDMDLSSFIDSIKGIQGIYGALHFGSSLFGRNFSVNPESDIDLEIIINDDGCDINAMKTKIFNDYDGDFLMDMKEFMIAKADYFSFKTKIKGRLSDIRITKKTCFLNICSNTLSETDDYIMKEFRRKYRENGIIPLRQAFDGSKYSWNNDIKYTTHGQIIYYPLFKYENGKFIAGNNLDKYCSYSKVINGGIELDKELFKLRKNFGRLYASQKEKIHNIDRISNIFIRNSKFPEHKKLDLEGTYALYNNL